MDDLKELCIIGQLTIDALMFVSAQCFCDIEFGDWGLYCGGMYESQTVSSRIIRLDRLKVGTAILES